MKTILGFPVVEGEFNFGIGDIVLGDFLTFKKRGAEKMASFIRYTHHDKEVWARRTLIGEHRKHCLCWDCKKFDPQDRIKNCPIANMVYKLCAENDLVLPVWECPVFESK